MSQRHFEPLSGGRSRIDWGITALLVVVFFVGLFWFTRGNGFASFYNPEEEIRAVQLIKGDWDLHHPLLSASSTKLLKTVLRCPDDLQAVVQLGRTVSAFFAVGSIICLGLAIYLLGNSAAACLLSILLLGQHQLFDVAHTMSENSALLFGASLTLLAIVLLEQKATVLRALLLGCSVAIALSAKYIGILLLIPALMAIFRCGDREFRVNRIVEFALGLLFTILVVNFYAVTELPVHCARCPARPRLGLCQYARRDQEFAAWDLLVGFVEKHYSGNLGDDWYFPLRSLDPASQSNNQPESFGLDSAHLFSIALVFALQRLALSAGHRFHLRIGRCWSCLVGRTHFYGS